MSEQRFDGGGLSQSPQVLHLMGRGQRPLVQFSPPPRYYTDVFPIHCPNFFQTALNTLFLDCAQLHKILPHNPSV